MIIHRKTHRNPAATLLLLSLVMIAAVGQALPGIYLFDPHEKLVASQVGGLTQADLENAIGRYRQSFKLNTPDSSK